MIWIAQLVAQCMDVTRAGHIAASYASLAQKLPMRRQSESWFIAQRMHVTHAGRAESACL
jgi:hypothetical protein